MNHSSLTNRKYAVPFVLITALFFLWGFARSILVVLNKHFQDSQSLTITQSSLIQVSCYLAYFVMALPAGIYISRLGYRRGVVTGLLIFALGAFLFIPGTHMDMFGLCLGALFILSCGLAFLETAANPYSTLLGPNETATSRLNLSQSINGLGGCLGPFIMGGYLFNQMDADPSIPYAIMGVLVILFAGIFGHVKLPEIQTEQCEEKPSQNPIRELLHNRMFVFGLCALLAYEVSEICINSYFVNYVTDMGWMEADEASYLLGLSLFAFMIGRFFGSWIMRYVSAAKLLCIFASGSILCMGMLLMCTAFPSETGTMPICFLMLNFLFESIMFPTIFSLALGEVNHLTKMASSLLMMTPVGGCGFMVMAIIADAMGGSTLPFVIPLAGFAVIWLYARKKI